MERNFNWKYVLYGIAAIFLALIVYELVSNKEPDKQDGPAAESRLTKEEPNVKKQPAEVVKVQPSKTDVSGPLHGYFEVVDRSYKIVNGKMNVEFRRIREGFPQPWESGMEIGYSEGHCEPGFYVELLDEDGDILSKDETSIIYDRSELQSLASLNTDETATISFSTGSAKPTGFRIGSSFTVHEPEPEDEEIEDEPSVKESSTTTASTPSTYNGTHANRNSSVSNTTNDNDDDDLTIEEYYDNDEDFDNDEDYDTYDDDDESTWQKVKKKSKRVYRKARKKFRQWLDK